MITCKTTGDKYVGLTVSKGRAFLKSAKTRFKKHVYRAQIEKADLPISQLIRRESPSAFLVEILEIVRGKETAHKREVELIKELEPSLNVLGK